LGKNTKFQVASQLFDLVFCVNVMFKIEVIFILLIGVLVGLNVSYRCFVNNGINFMILYDEVGMQVKNK